LRDDHSVEHLAYPFDIIKHNPEEGEEGEGEGKKTEGRVVVHRLAEGIADTEGDAGHDELEIRDLE